MHLVPDYHNALPHQVAGMWHLEFGGCVMHMTELETSLGLVHSLGQVHKGRPFQGLDMMHYEYSGSAKLLKELESLLDHSQGEHWISYGVNVIGKKHCGHLDFEEHWRETDQKLALQYNQTLPAPECMGNVVSEEVICTLHHVIVDCE